MPLPMMRGVKSAEDRPRRGSSLEAIPFTGTLAGGGASTLDMDLILAVGEEAISRVL